MSQPDLDERVANLERILHNAIERARLHPLGRKVLAYLGLL